MEHFTLHLGSIRDIKKITNSLRKSHELMTQEAGRATGPAKDLIDQEAKHFLQMAEEIDAAAEQQRQQVKEPIMKTA